MRQIILSGLCVCCIWACKETSAPEPVYLPPYIMHYDSSHFYFGGILDNYSMDRSWVLTIKPGSYEYGVSGRWYSSGAGRVILRDSVGAIISDDTLSSLGIHYFRLSQRNSLSIQISLVNFTGTFNVSIAPLGQYATTRPSR
jgi:hypothetical protein